MIRETLLLGLLMMFVGSCVTSNNPTTSPSTSDATNKNGDEPPPAPREFRGVWVATVGNIDWPSKPALPTAQQKKEAIAILDRCAQLNINAVIFQVRPAADALYHSDLEPWSYYLTGEQGKPPSPYYDPLRFWIDEAHKRGIELHAWFNPYRAKAGSTKYALATNHIAVAHPELVREFNGWQWMDPGEPAARDWTVNVFMDVAKRYDVDALHIDDYFYPYPDYLNGKDFPDDESYARYQQGGGKFGRDDWRRESINTTIRRIYQGLKEQKRWVKFGISPFGLGHKRPPMVKGFDPYEKLYADTEWWMKRGWCDYLTPQLYWKISATSQPFEPLLKFWIDSNPMHRNIYAGLFTGRAAFPDEETPSTQPTTRPTTRRARRAAAWDVEEILNQVKVARETPGAGGAVHFSMKSLMPADSAVANALKKDLYKDAALVPASPWLDNDPPSKPTVNVHVSGDGIRVTWSPGWGEKAFLWAVWEKRADGWKFHVYPSDMRAADLPGANAVCVSAVDRCGNESARAIARVGK